MYKRALINTFIVALLISCVTKSGGLWLPTVTATAPGAASPAFVSSCHRHQRVSSSHPLPVQRPFGYRRDPNRNELLPTERIKSTESEIILAEKNRNEEDSGSSASFIEPDDRHDEDVDALVNHYLGISDASNGHSGDGTKRSNKNGNNIDNNNHNRRAHVLIPQGVGKTTLALQTMTSLLEVKKNGNKTIKSAIYVTRKLKLVAQVFDECDKFGVLRNITHERLIVASNTYRKEDRTTDPEVIADFLSASEQSMKFALMVCTYDSLPRVGEAISILSRRGDSAATDISFATFDEAHFMEGIGTMSGYGLDDANIAIDTRLFVTATSHNYTERPEVVEVMGSKLGKDGSEKLIPKRTADDGKPRRVKARSIAHKELFGPCVVYKTDQECIDNNITLPIKVCAVDTDEISSILGQDIDPTYSRDQLLPLAVQTTFEKYNITKAVSFHSRIARAEQFVDLAKSVFGNDILAISANGKMKPKENERVLRMAEEAKKSVVANCKLFPEGVNIPEWQLVVMADPVRSPVSIKQMVGRVCRPHPGKELGYVLLPTVGEEGYKDFAAVFQVIVEGNPKLKRDVVFVMEEGRKRGAPLRVDEYPRSIGEAIQLPSSMPLEEKNLFFRRVVFEVGGGVQKWDEMYSLLKAYKEREGNCLVPGNHTEGKKSLGTWVRTQRTLQKREFLLEERKALLDEIGFVWDVAAVRWERMFGLLQQFKEREGHSDVPHDHKEDGAKLGHWLVRQRKKKKKGRLEESYIQRLEDAGVRWDVYGDQWERMFGLLEQFKEREGHADVPQGHKEDGMNLGHWLHKQRQKKKKGRLEESYVQRLEEVGVRWDVAAERWERMFDLLQQFKEREGHADVPQGHKEDGENLGGWLNTQRHYKKKGTLEEERIQRLEDAGVRWDVLGDQWESNFALLEQFVKREGHADVPRRHKEDGENLGHWLDKQRQKKKKGRLEESYVQRLEDVGVRWDVHGDQWESNFALLEQFVKREGHADVPYSHEEEGVNLGIWLYSQRQNKKKGRLDSEREERLVALGVKLSIR